MSCQHQPSPPHTPPHRTRHQICDERFRDSRARACVRPRRAEHRHRALRRRRVPPVAPTGACLSHSLCQKRRTPVFGTARGRVGSAVACDSPNETRTERHDRPRSCQPRRLNSPPVVFPPAQPHPVEILPASEFTADIRPQFTRVSSRLVFPTAGVPRRAPPC